MPPPERPPVQPLSLGVLQAHSPFFTELTVYDRSGKVPSTRPGTATASHSRPLAAWTVSTWTAPSLGSTYPLSRPRSSSRAALSHDRKPPRFGRSALTEKVAATSANASRWARATLGVYPGR